MDVTKISRALCRPRQGLLTAWCGAALIASASVAHAQASAAQTLPPAPSATVRPLVLPSGIVIAREQPGVVRLTLDEAIAAALKNNTELFLRNQQEKYVRGQIFTVGSALTPNLSLEAYSRAQEINLAAQGFKAGTKVPGFSGTIPTIVKVNTSDVQLNVSQQLLNVPAFFLFSAARKAAEAANWSTLAVEGNVVLATGGLYLKTLADEAQIANAQALVKQDQLVLNQATAAREAGVGVNIDVLRAQVQLQAEQQQLVRAEDAAAKDKIQLNREMNQPAGQAIELVDTVPFAEFNELPLDGALKLAFVRRKDYRGLEAQLAVAEKAQQAVRFERLPTVGIGGFYGVLGQTTGLYHGDFAAEGFVSIPVFQEATLRGQKEVAAAQTTALRNQIESDRQTIEAQIRTSMLDVESSRKLVEVARSNMSLATEALSDATERFTAGVDTDLPVVEAQAILEGAQAQVIQAEFQYNYSKLLLARNTGVVETQYRTYLGK